MKLGKPRASNYTFESGVVQKFWVIRIGYPSPDGERTSDFQQTLYVPFIDRFCFDAAARAWDGGNGEYPFVDRPQEVPKSQ